MFMDERKFDEIERVIDEYQEGLFRFAFFRTGALEDSQDIVQNIFLKMYDEGRHIGVIENVKSYLYRSISNSCSNYLRKKQSIKNVPLSYAESQLEDDSNDDLIKEYERIKKMIEDLPYEQTEVIHLRTIDGLAFTEIAEILEIPVTTAKSRFRYGIDKLKSKINKQEIIL